MIYIYIYIEYIENIYSKVYKYIYIYTYSSVVYIYIHKNKHEEHCMDRCVCGKSMQKLRMPAGQGRMGGAALRLQGLRGTKEGRWAWPRIVGLNSFTPWILYICIDVICVHIYIYIYIYM